MTPDQVDNIRGIQFPLVSAIEILQCIATQGTNVRPMLQEGMLGLVGDGCSRSLDDTSLSWYRSPPSLGPATFDFGVG